MSPDGPRHRRWSWRRRLVYRLRPPGSPNLWLIIPLLIAGVLLVGWIVGTLATTDLAAWARNLVRQKGPF